MGRKSISHIRKPEILKHTYQIIKEEGLEGASITKIAKRMGINSGIIINNFKNKETLILELVDYMLTKAMGNYRTFMETSNTSPERQLEVMIDYFFDPGLKPIRSNVFWACFALSFRNEKTKSEIRKMYLFFVNQLIQFLNDAQSGGRIEIDNKELLAHVLLTAIEGTGYLKMIRGNTAIVKQTYTFYKNAIKNMLNLPDPTQKEASFFIISDPVNPQQTEGRQGSSILTLFEEDPADTLPSRIIDLNHFVQAKTEACMDDLDAAGIEWGVVFSPYNKQTARMIKKFPDRLKGVALIDPYHSNASKKTKQAVKEFGFSAVYVSPSHWQIPANDPRFYPIYSMANELGIPVFIHSAMNYDTQISMDLGRPIHIDPVAMSFPDLKIVATCGGWPWVNEMVGLARRHRNVYIETAFDYPENMTAGKSGWEMLLQFGNTLLQDRIVFGSRGKEIESSLSSVIQKAKRLPLKPEVKQKWMYGNAAKLFGLT